ncbi:type II secretion system minor pseudopilin GspK [Marinimicrobium sp. ABcell2]|uniref:type II secretion system minor pseudopilin GspK n=1 Tax=Marinimicrobium sp. ABcell2 TaxID=3069751 RepID=UPI0027B2D749|nr:type II secretion system minor pseudopilin GspK [Marinimicrobium sp. ABcell2]MDQ2076656.1 type II secretion system minor pseudopilin GspK [Marinimicrobium sp. ABcell2]
MSACLTLSAFDRRGSVKIRASARKQKGAVLIIALLIVSVAAGLAIRFAGDFQLGMARAESRWHGAQTRSYLRGAENMAVYMLSQFGPAPDLAYRGEDWDVEFPFEIDEAWGLVAVDDARSRFNLNDLAGDLTGQHSHNDWQRFSEPQRRFIRLLQSFPNELPLHENEAIAILEAVVDWMDPDDQVSGFGGAEADYYQSMDPPYRPANSAFVSVDELRLVRHVTPELMTLLRPHLVVLPAGQGLNINTVSDLLLGTINTQETLQPLTDMDVGLLRQDWPPDGFFSSVQDFAGNTAWQSIGSTPNTQGLDVATEYFLVTTQVSLVQQRRSMESVLHRVDTNRYEVVRRSDSF